MTTVAARSRCLGTIVTCEMRSVSFSSKYLCPDRREGFSRQQAPAGLDADDEDNAMVSTTQSKSSRRKPAYAGGLVLEPKVGFYDRWKLSKMASHHVCDCLCFCSGSSYCSTSTPSTLPSSKSTTSASLPSTTPTTLMMTTCLRWFCRQIRFHQVCRLFPRQPHLHTACPALSYEQAS